MMKISQALFGHLLRTTELVNLIQGVHTHVPDNPKMPFIRVGDYVSDTWHKEYNCEVMHFKIEVFSDQAGAQECMNIMAALEQACLSFQAPEAVHYKIAERSITQVPQAKQTWHGNLTFKIWILI
jgi:hypothetical protein